MGGWGDLIPNTSQFLVTIMIRSRWKEKTLQWEKNNPKLSAIS